jgi:hypothetical protein
MKGDNIKSVLINSILFAMVVTGIWALGIHTPAITNLTVKVNPLTRLVGMYLFSTGGLKPPWVYFSLTFLAIFVQWFLVSFGVLLAIDTFKKPR